MIKNNLILILAVFLFLGCKEKIMDGAKLSKNTITLIQDLGILDEDEHILYYYSCFTKKTCGNFITDKRMAMYWLHNKSTEIKSAYYNEIKSIEIKYGDGFEFTSAFIVELNSGDTFNVYFNGAKKEVDELYNRALKLWNDNKGMGNVSD